MYYFKYILISMFLHIVNLKKKVLRKLFVEWPVTCYTFLNSGQKINSEIDMDKSKWLNSLKGIP